MRVPRFTVATTALVLSLAAIGVTSCEVTGWNVPQPRKYVLVFVDASSSVRPEDLELYRTSFKAVSSKLGPGDKIELGLLSDSTLTRYIPQVLEVLPDSERRLDQDRGMRAVRSKLAAAFPSAPGSAKKTKILDALELAEQRFAADTEPGRSERWLVLLSDMQEDSEDLNLESRPPSDKNTEAFIKTRRDKHRLPSLPGVRVYVAGASSATAQSFDAIKQFWMQYLAAAGAHCDTASYQRAPLRFD